MSASPALHVSRRDPQPSAILPEDQVRQQRRGRLWRAARGEDARRLLGLAAIEQHIDQEGERVGPRSPPVGRGDFNGVAGIRLSFAEAAGSVLQE